jgi:drug/metabolite transporter (DMT)-like permease
VPVTWTLVPVASLVVLGTLGTGVAYAINFRLIQDEGATNASTVTYLLPVVAVILGALFLAEAVTVNVLAGTLVVFVGIALTQQRLRLPGRRTPPPAPAASVSPTAPEGLVRSAPDRRDRSEP